MDDPLILYGFIAGFVLNAVLAGQMVYYWNSPTKGKRISNKVDQREKVMMESSSSGSEFGSKSAGPSTRRRG